MNLDNPFSLLSAFARDLVSFHDREGNYVGVSASVTNLFGYQPEELVGVHPQTLIHEEDRNRVRSWRERIGQGSHPAELAIVLRFRHRQGHYLWVESTLSLVGTPGQEDSGYVGITRVVDERVQREQRQLELVNLAVHEFRTPLQVIRTTAERLLSRYPDPRLETIIQETDRLNLLVGDMLSLGAVTTPPDAAGKMPVNLVQLLQQVLGRLALMYPVAREVVPRYEGAPRMVQANGRQLEPVLENLLSNALKYSPGRPAPACLLQFGTAAITVTITDNGIGIPEAELPKVLDPFFRASNTTGQEGTGVGMLIVHRYVEAEKGKISIRSEEGKGTTVELWLPH